MLYVFLSDSSVYDERSPSAEDSSSSQRTTVKQLFVFLDFHHIRDHLILLQNCHKQNNSLKFHCEVLTSMVVGNMTQAL